MIKDKKVEGKDQPKDLWRIPVEPVTMRKFAIDTADTEKVLWFGESNSGKTKSYLDILGYYKAKGIPKEKVMMCILFPDRSTGITKLYNLIPKEYVDRVFIYAVNCYEDVVKATADAEKKLLEHHKQTGTQGWLICELLESVWQYAQDYYARRAFGESLADLLTAKRQQVQEMMTAKDKPDKDTAYLAMSGWTDWTCVKFFHNFNWIDRIKKMQFNVGATAEIKAETNKDSIFFAIGIRPSGEKSNVHRFDTIIYKSHKGNKYTQQCFKWTGMSRLYSETDITDKNSWSVHKMIQKKFEAKGYRSSAIEELEEEAGITLPKKEVLKSTPVLELDLTPSSPKLVPAPEQPKPEVKKEPTVSPAPKPIQAPPVKTVEPLKVETKKEEQKEEIKVVPKPAETSATISKTPEGEKVEQISKEEIIVPKKKEEKKEPVDDFDWSV